MESSMLPSAVGGFSLWCKQLEICIRDGDGLLIWLCMAWRYSVFRLRRNISVFGVDYSGRLVYMQHIVDWYLASLLTEYVGAGVSQNRTYSNVPGQISTDTFHYE